MSSPLWPIENTRKRNPGSTTPGDASTAWLVAGSTGVAFENDWANYAAPLGGVPWPPLQYRRTEFGLFEIVGLVAKPTPATDANARFGSPILRLPSGYRPRGKFEAYPFAVWGFDAPTSLAPLLPGTLVWVGQANFPIGRAELSLSYLIEG